MTDDYKARIKKATEKFLTKNDPNRIKRKNKSPELDLEREAIRYFNSMGWDLDSIESKNQYDPRSGKYLASPNESGIVDCVGNDNYGNAVYIEWKAPGKISTLREKQRMFLIRKINTNCFAVVADSIKFVEEHYNAWLSHSRPRDFLFSLLPKEKRNERDFDL